MVPKNSTYAKALNSPAQAQRTVIGMDFQIIAKIASTAFEGLSKSILSGFVKLFIDPTRQIAVFKDRLQFA